MSRHQPLAAYLPMEVRHALARGAQLGDRTSGAALFADMSGFTALSTAYAEALGPSAGAEALAGALEAVFARLVGTVHNYRGSVVGFSGDAITCWFDGGGLLDITSRRAMTAALLMRDAVSSLAPLEIRGGGALSLGIKLAVAAGEVRRFVVGDPAVQQLEVFGGETMRRMAMAEGLAARGEVVVSEEVVGLTGGGTDVKEWRSAEGGQRFAVVRRATPTPPSPWPDLPPVPAEALEPWVMRAVAERIGRGEGGFLGAFRRVVALFLRFDGIDYEGDTSADLALRSFFGQVQVAVAGRGGHVVDVTIGDKGSYLFAAFGALRAQEDAARRALATALELRHTCPVTLELRTGIAQSRVYTGSYGCEARMTFGVVGSDVNVAARLMGACVAGEILVTPGIAKGLADAFDFEDRPPLRLKGVADEMAPRALLSERAASQVAVRGTGAQTPLVGRVAERRVVADALEALGSGRGGGLVIEGAAGMGKSKLLDHVQSGAEALGIRSLRGAADAMRDAVPYYAWREIFEKILGLEGAHPGAAEPASRADLVSARLASVAPELVALAPLLNPILSIALPDSDSTRHMEGRVRSDNTYEVLVRLLRSELGADPAVILLEDLHWFDSSSLGLLARVARELPGCLVVATRRPATTEASRVLAADPWSVRARTLAITRLEAGEIAELLANGLGVFTIPEPVLHLVERKAEGSPFFSQEIVYALRDRGLLEITNGVCRLAPRAGDLTEIDFPDTIQGVIANRVDELPAPQQLALKVASVIGRSFDARLLRDVLPVEEDRADLDRNLDALVGAAITERDESAGETRYVFRHALTQEVAYDMLLHRQRQELHLSVGRWFEREHAGEINHHYPVLAYHMSRAARGGALDREGFSKTLEYLEQAGQESLRGHSNDEAVRFYREALDLAETYGAGDAAAGDGADAVLRSARWRRGLATAYLGLGQFRLCQETAKAGLVRLGHPLPSSNLKLVGGILTQLLLQAVRRMRQGPVGALRGERAEFVQELIHLQRLLSKALFHDNGLIQMRYLNAHSLNLSERMGASSGLALAYTFELLARGLSQHPSARGYGKRALEIAREAGDPVRLATVLVNHGMYHLALGEWDAAERMLEEGRALTAEIRDHWQRGELTALLADSAWMRGDLERSRLLYDEVYRAAEQHGMYLQMGWCIRPRLLAALREGRPRDAIEMVESSRGVWGEVPDPLMHIDAHGVLALAHLRLGNRDAALDGIREVASLAARVTPPVAYPRLLGYTCASEASLTLLADARAGGAAPEQLREMSKAAVHNLALYAKGFPIGRPAARLHAGWLALLDGRSRQAAEAFGESLQRAIELRMPFDEANARFFIARHSSKDEHERDEHLRSALRTFRELGATREAELVERELESASVARVA